MPGLPHNNHWKMTIQILLQKCSDMNFLNLIKRSGIAGSWTGRQISGLGDSSEMLCLANQSQTSATVHFFFSFCFNNLTPQVEQQCKTECANNMHIYAKYLYQHLKAGYNLQFVLWYCRASKFMYSFWKIFLLPRKYDQNILRLHTSGFKWGTLRLEKGENGTPAQETSPVRYWR